MHTLILNHLLLSVLDSETHKALELHSATQDVPSTTQVMAFLEQRCKALELIQTSQATNATTALSRHTSSVSGNKVSQTSRSYMTRSVSIMQRITLSVSLFCFLSGQLSNAWTSHANPNCVTIVYNHSIRVICVRLKLQTVTNATIHHCMVQPIISQLIRYLLLVDQ
jgi:succinate dehydrogenase/fumarate reductase cytochrome b subunit